VFPTPEIQDVELPYFFANRIEDRIVAHTAFHRRILGSSLQYMRSTAMSRRAKADQGYLVAKFPDFGGVEIPLISEEECRARGIEPGRLPPRETWTQKQRDAADRLMEILAPRAYLEALHIILAELELEPRDSKIPEAEIEKAAARRGIALIDSGKWKQHDSTIHLPKSWVRQMLEAFVSGELSLLDPPPLKRRRKKAKVLSQQHGLKPSIRAPPNLAFSTRHGNCGRRRGP
jgi:hypothetical protein